MDAEIKHHPLCLRRRPLLDKSQRDPFGRGEKSYGLGRL